MLYANGHKVCPVIEVKSGYQTKNAYFTENVFTSVDSNGKLTSSETTRGDLVFTGFKDVGDECFSEFLYDIWTSVASDNVIFKDLLYISGEEAFSYAFAGCPIKNLSFPLLEEITGYRAFESACNSSDVEVLLLPRLSRLYGSEVFYSCLNSCKKITDIYFNSLTSTSFGSNTDQFSWIFDYRTAEDSGTCTIHFPSNLESTIQGLIGYPYFGGQSGRIVLAYDLPATS